ncbi:hypothetical protein Nepgr_015828 [Nepenthes gracilis]|uniref:Uncharacterized protein n=1 Tax=Nepenthes gracilis TaxID=150966 RepID=A0AAD3SMQ5_NEPGR|nr:hypothetical protein Nepgr_015828 [Nepenthes gracilis]
MAIIDKDTLIPPNNYFAILQDSGFLGAQWTPQRSGRPTKNLVCGMMRIASLFRDEIELTAEWDEFPTSTS